jgi:hypothetical protein
VGEALRVPLDEIGSTPLQRHIIDTAPPPSVWA